MTVYTMSANAIAFAQVRGGKIWVRTNTPSGDMLTGMSVGDVIVPYLESEPYHGDSGAADFKFACNEVKQDEQIVLDVYRTTVPRDGAVAFILTISNAPRRAIVANIEVVQAEVNVEDLTTQLSGNDFLRLRALEEATATQFKGSTPLLRIVEESPSLPAAVRDASRPNRDTARLLRRYSLVDASDAADAIDKLQAADRSPIQGDRAFIVNRSSVPGLAYYDADTTLKLTPNNISRSPEAIKDLLLDAQRRTFAKDPFDAEPAISAVNQLIGLIQDGEDVEAIDDFRKFYEYSVLANTVTSALAIQRRPLPNDLVTEHNESAGKRTNDEVINIKSNLAGLTVEAVTEQLPAGFEVPRPVLAAAVAALRSGKHLLLGGPPGTGKTTLAEALCRAVVGKNYHVATATADWTTFDTIGGYLPDSTSGLKFSAGVVLRSLRTAGWLVIDEVNRADIDKAFGPLFTVLSGGDGTAGRTSTLPYSNEDGPISIRWSDNLEEDSSAYEVTPAWRLIGTLNVADKSSLFRLSFAFLRRFAVIDVPLPDPATYAELFARWLEPGHFDDLPKLVDAFVAASNGPVPVGPAIGRDLAEFVIQAVIPTASGSPAFSSPEDALAVAIRLFVVPQYEGQPIEDGETFIAQLKATTLSLSVSAITEIQASLREVALS